MSTEQCKTCRASNIKLFLKGERCFSPRCAMVRKPYSPGQKGKRRRRTLSEYGKELKEKQKLKNLYNLNERQFRKYVKEISEFQGKTVDASALLIKTLESRLDNVVFRLGLASSRLQARQLLAHSHFLVNEKPVNIPSFTLKKGDVIKLKPRALKKTFFQNIAAKLKKYNPPAWLKLNLEKMEGKVIGEPNLEEIAPPVEIPTIFEYYSR